MLKRTAILLLSLTPLACKTTSQSTPPGADDAEVTVGELVASWRVLQGEHTCGWLRRYCCTGGAPGAVFVVQNEFMQDIGYVDSHGRAWRRRPHQQEKQWLTTDTVLEGTRRILDLAELPRLEESASAASTSKSPEEYGSAGLPEAGLENASAKKRG